MTGLDFYKKTLGIFGMGNIGQAVAKIATGFSMDIIYHNRHRDKQAELIFGATYATFDELLEWSDFLIITAPLTLETRHIFSLREFKKMKKKRYHKKGLTCMGRQQSCNRSNYKRK